MYNDKHTEFERDSLKGGTFSPETVIIDQHYPMKLSSKSVSLLFSVSSCPRLMSKIFIVQTVHTIFTRCVSKF